MKILKEVSRKYKEKEYIKYKINLPISLIESAGFNAGDELSASTQKGQIILKKAVKIVD